MPIGDRVWLRRSLLLLACAWPLSLHFAILFASPQWPARVNAAALALCAGIWTAAGHARAARLFIAAALLALIDTVLVLSPQTLLFAPSIAINALLAAFFGASLRAGREPLIGIFARLEQGDLQPDLARHARLITWCWTVLLAAIAAISLILAAWAPMESWSLFTNVVSYSLISSLFVGEYLYRRLRYRHYRHASLVTLVRNVRRANLFARR